MSKRARHTAGRRPPDPLRPGLRRSPPAAAAPVSPVGPPVRALSYATRLRELANLDLEEGEAADLWRSVARHRRELMRKLGRDVGHRVALLDYVVNVHPRVVEPAIIETAALEAIKRDAISDGPTGLYNRHYFECALRREVERGHRYGASISLLLLDLDEFKEINDQYGHRVGDRVLEAIAAIVAKHLRAADLACRYGGDEFAVILSDTDQPDAVTVAERIRADVETTFEREPVCGHFLEVSVSGGIATLPLDADAAEPLFQVADQALYEAKRAGGNRVATPAAIPTKPLQPPDGPLVA